MQPSALADSAPVRHHFHNSPHHLRGLHIRAFDLQDVWFVIDAVVGGVQGGTGISIPAFGWLCLQLMLHSAYPSCIRQTAVAGAA
jgi:hypothetical protein